MALVRYAATFVVSLALGILLAVTVGPLGLVVPGSWILPVTFGVAAASSALGAAWTSNLSTGGGSRARLGWVLLGTEATALVILGLLAAVSFLAGELVQASFFLEIVVSMIPIALNATILSERSREARTRWMPDVLLSLAVVAVALAAPVLLLVVACPYIGCTG